jgi:hypothetical protein
VSLIVAVAMALVLRFAWAPLLMAAVLLGLKSPSEMFAMLVVLAVVAAAMLHLRLSGKPF